MEFRLTYEGKLLSHRDDGASMRARAPHKHEIRKVFHKQLKHFWDTHPNLVGRQTPYAPGTLSKLEELAQNFTENGFRFAPLVNKQWDMVCKLEILMLRPGEPGAVLHKADIDNRLKTLFDALKKPDDRAGLGGATPEADEDPFFVLLEDDSLITHVAVETDSLLQPISGDINDVRLVIKVIARPYTVGMHNLSFT